MKILSAAVFGLIFGISNVSPGCVFQPKDVAHEVEKQFDPSCRKNGYADERYATSHYTDYTVKEDVRTPSGIAVDRSGYNIDLKKIDALTRELEECLGYSIDRCGFRIKIPDDNIWLCGNEELFRCDIYATSCEPESCTCGCLGIVQYPAIAVITPNLSAYKHELIHIVEKADHSDPVFVCQ